MQIQCKAEMEIANIDAELEPEKLWHGKKGAPDPV